jgi:serine/threonine protein kinase
MPCEVTPDSRYFVTFCTWSHQTPCAPEPQAELQRQIVNNYVTFPWSVDPQLQDLILECLKKDPKERIDAREILDHPWIVAGQRGRGEVVARGDWYARGGAGRRAGPRAQRTMQHSAHGVVQ